MLGECWGQTYKRGMGIVTCLRCHVIKPLRVEGFARHLLLFLPLCRWMMEVDEQSILMSTEKERGRCILHVPSRGSMSSGERAWRCNVMW